MSKQPFDNSWGNGDIFSRIVDPDSTERIRPAGRGPVEHPGAPPVIRILGWAILAGVLFIVLACVLAAVVGVVLGFITGIGEVL